MVAVVRNITKPHVNCSTSSKFIANRGKSGIIVPSVEEFAEEAISLFAEMKMGYDAMEKKTLEAL